MANCVLKVKDNDRYAPRISSSLPENALDEETKMREVAKPLQMK